VAAAIEVGARDDVIAGLEQVQDVVDGGEAARECQPEASVLERREVRLQRAARGVLAARVGEALVHARLALRERGGLVDGDGDRAGGGVVGLARVDGAGIETGGHGEAPWGVRGEWAAGNTPEGPELRGLSVGAEARCG